jgi:hypothetical protein
LSRAGASERSVSLSLDGPTAWNDHASSDRRSTLLFGSGGTGAADDFARHSSFAIHGASWPFDGASDARAGGAAEQIFSAGRIQLSKFASVAHGGAFGANSNHASASY